MIASAEQIAATLETAIVGSRKVAKNGFGWSVVSQREIVAMAMMIQLLFDNAVPADDAESATPDDGEQPHL